MRSVFVFLRSAEQPEVERWLSENYTFHARPQAEWTMDVSGYPYLQAIQFDDAWRCESEPEAWQKFVQRFGGEPSCFIVADVTGRYEADEQVRSFVLSILGRFDGVVMDNYTEHGWTRSEVESNCLIQGHPFCDTLGWYEESHAGRSE